MSRRGRGYVVSLLAGLCGAVLAAVAGTNVWARGTGSAAGIEVDASIDGSSAAPLATALALVVLAAWGVVLVVRGRLRRVVTVVQVLAAAGAVVAVITGLPRARDLALAELADKAAGSSATVSTTGWVYAAAVGALLALGAGVVAVAKVGTWPEMGTKYDAPASRAEQPVSEQDMWRALDAGQDPTS